MAEFMDPHNQMDADRPYSREELIRALRKDIAAEEEAISVYESHAAMCKHPEIKQMILDIVDEERVHVGEFQEMIERLSKSEEQLIQQGREEVEEELGEEETAPEQIAKEME